MISTIETVAAPLPVTLKEIEAKCATLASARKRAQKLMESVERQRAAILDEHAEAIRELADELNRSRQEVESAVKYGRQFFGKPKTLVFSGIEVGFEKERDKLEVPEDSILIPRIETMLRAKASTLIRTAKSIVAEAFKQLTPAEKQSLGCRTITGADRVVVRAEVKSDVEKYFNACAAAAARKN
jgi:phage host-nuclease inhibitor protein Gam